jgi:hypothetical protein
MIGLKNGLAPRSTSQPAQALHAAGSPDQRDSITNNNKRQNIISSVKKRFEDKFGQQASPHIDKYLQELNKKDKVSIHVSYIILCFLGQHFAILTLFRFTLCTRPYT